MRVVEVARFGGPEVLTVVEAPDPVAGPGDVVVAVAAADVLWVDTMIRSGAGGAYFPVRPPYRPGSGVAGPVVAVGAGVDPGWIGRPVLTRTPAGGYAEQVAVPAAGLIEVPEGLDPAGAAALLHDGVTALGLLDVVAVKPGERVLVTAAAGGLGALLVQLVHAAGAEVVAAARGRRKLERLPPLGADLVVDYSEPEWTTRTGGPVDVVLDGAGGAYGRAALGLVAPGGRFSGHGTPAGSFVGPGDGAAEGVTVTGIDRVQFDADRFRRYAVAALAEAAAGRVTPLIGQTFPLARAAEAHAAIENRTAIGKTLLV